MYSTSFKLKDFHKDSISFFKNKNVIVTGGTGFIGSHLVEQLVSLQAKPIIFSKSLNKNFLASCEKNIEILEVELFEKEYATFVDSKYSIGVANGLDALVLSLKNSFQLAR